MASDSRLLIAVAGEDHAHRVLAMRLVDAVVLERADGGWPARDELAHFRVWCGWRDDPNDAEERCFYPIFGLVEDLREVTPKRFFRTNRIGDEPAGEALWFISLYQLFALRSPRPDLLIGMRDASDRGLERQAERACDYLRDTLGAEMTVVFGLPYRDAEAWFVAGLGGVPEGRRAMAKRTLQFDPIAQPHRLTSEPNTAVTDAKRVLRFLLGEGAEVSDARSVAISVDDLDELADRTLDDLTRLERAVESGLAGFVTRLRSAPLEKR